MTEFPIFQIVFYVFSALLILSSFMVIFMRDLVKAVLFLVLCFFAAAVLWMLLQAEFLALVLLFVYVGAVMTLFIFVVFMLSVTPVKIDKKSYYKFLLFAFVVVAAMLGVMIFVLSPEHFLAGTTMPVNYPAGYSNIKVIGNLLYSDYVYQIEVVAAILLVAMISAIALGFYGAKTTTHQQKISEQEKASKENRLRITKGGRDYDSTK